MQLSLFKTKIRIRLRRDRSIILICLASSLLFWFFVKLAQEYSIRKQFDLIYQLPPNKAFVQMPPSNVMVSLSGTGWDLISIYFNKSPKLEFDVYANFGGRVTEQTLTRRIEDALAGEDLTIKGLDYQEINLQFEDSMDKKVPVRLRAKLEFAQEHQLRSEPVLTPDSVIVRGPISIIEPLVEWPTDSVKARGLKSDIKIEATLLPPSNGSIKLIPSTITLDLEVELFVEKEFYIPVTVNLESDSTNIVPYPRIVLVTAVVGMSRFNELKAEDFVLEAILDGIKIHSENDLAPLEITKAPDYVRNIRLAQQSARFNFSLTDSLSTE